MKYFKIILFLLLLLGLLLPRIIPPAVGQTGTLQKVAILRSSGWSDSFPYSDYKTVTQAFYQNLLLLGYNVEIVTATSPTNASILAYQAVFSIGLNAYRPVLTYAAQTGIVVLICRDFESQLRSYLGATTYVEWITGTDRNTNSSSLVAHTLSQGVVNDAYDYSTLTVSTYEMSFTVPAGITTLLKTNDGYPILQHKTSGVEKWALYWSRAPGYTRIGEINLCDNVCRWAGIPRVSQIMYGFDGVWLPRFDDTSNTNYANAFNWIDSTRAQSCAN